MLYKSDSAISRIVADCKRILGSYGGKTVISDNNSVPVFIEDNWFKRFSIVDHSFLKIFFSDAVSATVSMKFIKSIFAWY